MSQLQFKTIKCSDNNINSWMDYMSSFGWEYDRIEHIHFNKIVEETPLVIPVNGRLIPVQRMGSENVQYVALTLKRDKENPNYQTFIKYEKQVYILLDMITKNVVKRDKHTALFGGAIVSFVICLILILVGFISYSDINNYGFLTLGIVGCVLILVPLILLYLGFSYRKEDKDINKLITAADGKNKEQLQAKLNSILSDGKKLANSVNKKSENNNPSSNEIDEATRRLKSLKELLDSNIITQAEYDEQKAKLIKKIKVD